MQEFQSLSIMFGDKASCPYFEGCYTRFKCCDIGEQVGIFVLLCSVGKIKVGFKAYSQLPKMKAILLSVQNDYVGPVEGDYTNFIPYPP